MNSTALSLLLLSALSPAQVESAPALAGHSFQTAIASSEEPFIVRAQSEGGVPLGPILGPTIQSETTTNYPPTYVNPNAAFAPPGTPYAAPPGSMPGPITTDPWLGGGPGMPYAAPATGGPFGQYTYGVNGPQPYRYGWTARYDFTYMPSEGTSSPNVGSLGIFGFDLEKELVRPLPTGWVFSIAPQYNLRLWDGPRGTPGQAHLPGDAHRFGLGLKLATPDFGGNTFEFGFNPALATDFEESLSRNTFQFDGHAVWFWRWTPQFMVALGAAYWDRVDDIVLPYAGVVWNPNDRLEFRLLFPKPRISLFLGAPSGIATWAYVSGEYHVESYEISMSPPGARDQVQLTDWRLLGGMRFETGWLTTFVEAGGVFGRDVEFRNASSTDFDLNSGFIGRAGFRY